MKIEKLLKALRLNPNYNITIKDVIALRDFSINMFDFIKSKGLLQEFNDKCCIKIKEHYYAKS